jgi:hypothetical protein
MAFIGEKTPQRVRRIEDWGKKYILKQVWNHFMTVIASLICLPFSSSDANEI